MVEEGTHEELMAKGGLYAGLYQMQAMAVTPVSDRSDEEEKKAEEKEEEEESGEIPDEIPESQMKTYGMLTLFKRTHTASLLFWIGFLGNVLRVVFQPLYAYASSVLQSVLHALGRLVSPP